MSNEIEAKNLLNQIKSEARAEGLMLFFFKHKKLVIRVAIAFLAFLLLFFVFSLIRGSMQEKYSEILHQSLIEEELGNISKAQENLETIYNATFATPGVKGLASLRYASILLQQNKTKEALEVYKKTAKTMLFNDFVQETAALTAIKLITVNFDENSDKNLQNKTKAEIAKLAKGNKILRDSFLEQQAIFALKIGDKDKARAFLEKITKSEEATKTEKSRAADLIKLTN